MQINLKSTLFLIIISLIIIINIPITSAKYSCKTSDGAYICTIPLNFKINNTIYNQNSSDNVNKGKLLVKIENTSIESTINSSTEIVIYFENYKNKTIEVEYYGYIYSGSKCVSCNTSREENIYSIKIEPDNKLKQIIRLTSKEAGNFSFKIKYKETELKTWKEIIGNIKISQAQNATKKEIIEKEENIKIKEEKNTLELDSAQIESKLKSILTVDEKTLNSTPIFIGLDGKKSNPKENQNIAYISKQKFIGNYIFIIIASGAILLSIVSLIKN